ncbi:MAG: hypothetical protein F6J87_28560, partial [Spirulina sp. SIO3F2]|nr:hypothetical protein [Spirulina sp. SIO3F2]
MAQIHRLAIRLKETKDVLRSHLVIFINNNDNQLPHHYPELKTLTNLLFCRGYPSMFVQSQKSLAQAAKVVGLSVALSLLSLGTAGKAALAQCVPATFPENWLQQQEDAGGHTIARHVGRTDQQLVERLINSPRISAASTYPDLATATTNIQAALTTNAATLNSWVSEAAVGEKRAVNYRAGAVIGRVASRPPSLSHISNSSRLQAVMKKTADGGCLLLTSYP